jgi:hypothetical protein
MHQLTLCDAVAVGPACVTMRTHVHTVVQLLQCTQRAYSVSSALLQLRADMTVLQQVLLTLSSHLCCYKHHARLTLALSATVMLLLRT